ncbi:DUF3187 family protein [Psychrobium sp. 1_MG-2023]|uniref:DUF3187 family protein n=1 Tax=Psychrobium sp. 1_MG-2023 TaxID=3062624 RepID=UPI002691644E|nr:DUF3187 family protein [Psychrobium sp. 1_MG-2023]MDP2560818.1 DUF3187 family protein [Psychrobium sp. 1_MG-2023]
MRLILLIVALLYFQTASADVAPRTTATPLPGAGPFEIRTQSPIQSLRYSVKIRDPRRENVPHNSYWAYINSASIWTHSDEYSMDYYTSDYQLGWQREWQYGLKTELAFTQRNTNLVKLDQLTLSFHKAFGLSQNGRDRVPKHQYTYWFRDYDINETGFKNNIFSRAVEFYISKNLYQDKTQSLSIGHISHYEEQSGHRGWDFAGQIDYYYSFNEYHQLYASLAHSRFHSENFFKLPLKDELSTLGLSYEYQPTSDRSWVVQYLLNEGATKKLGQLGQLSHELLLGHRWIIDNHQLEVAMIENLINPDNSADIAFSIVYRYKPNL